MQATGKCETTKPQNMLLVAHLSSLAGATRAQECGNGTTPRMIRATHALLARPCPPLKGARRDCRAFASTHRTAYTIRFVYAVPQAIIGKARARAKSSRTQPIYIAHFHCLLILQLSLAAPSTSPRSETHHQPCPPSVRSSHTSRNPSGTATRCTGATASPTPARARS